MNPPSAIDLELLRRFLAVAHAGTVRKAALALGLSQAPLTRSIQQLEERLSSPLLERRRDGIGLTRAGQALAAQAPPLLAHAERLCRSIEGLQDVRRLNVGFSALNGRIARAIADFKARLPACEFRLRQLPTAEQHRRLADGTLDAGLVFGGHTDPVDGLQSRVLENSQVALAVPEAWPLAARPRVGLAELAGLPFIGSSRESNPFRRELLEDRCRAAGFTPDIVHECTQMSDCLRLVSIGLGVSFVTARAVGNRVSGVRCVPLDDDLSDLELRFSLIWVQHNPSASLHHFIECVERNFRKLPVDIQQGSATAHPTKGMQHG
jgi:DNA-binding transcriptional LysR family regulator